MTHPTNPNDEHGPGCDGCRELRYVRRIEELTAERDAAERRVVEIENLDDRDGAVIRANTRASAAVRASIDAEERATGLAAVIERAKATLRDTGMGFHERRDRAADLLASTDTDAALREVRSQPHEMWVIDGEIEVCNRCVNSDGNPIAWGLTWHEAAIREGRS